MKLNFKAAILEKNNTPLTIRKINFTGNLERGQVLVKLKFTGICGKQIDEIKALEISWKSSRVGRQLGIN